jgi:hypothetical protein
MSLPPPGGGVPAPSVPPTRGKAPSLPLSLSGKAAPAKAGAPPPVPVRLGPQLLGSKVPGSALPPKQANDLLNVHWKSAPHNPSLPPYENDQFLKPFSRVSASPSSVLLGSVPSPLLKSPLYPSVFSGLSLHSSSITLPSHDAVRKYFQRKQNKMFENMNSGLNSANNADDRLKTSLDKERMKLISLALGGSLGSKSINKRQVFRLYREAILECHYEIAKMDVLCPLLQLLENVHPEELTNVISSISFDVSKDFSVAESTILDQYEEADVFLYEMSKIPQVKTRLECMIFVQSFEGLYDLSKQSLDVVYSAIEVIHVHSSRLAKFFQFVLKTGNTLNEGSRLGNQSSFSLSSLDKLVEVKSSFDPKVDLLHFIIATYPGDSGEILFSDADLAKLKKAANLRCYRVRDEVKDLLDSVRAIEELPEVVGTGDKFSIDMKRFSESASSKKLWLSNYAFNTFSSYKDLCDFFGDPHAVYPPPKERSADQFDIIELFAGFGTVVRQHEKDVKKLKLRSKIGGTPITSPKVTSVVNPVVVQEPPAVVEPVIFQQEPNPISAPIIVPKKVDTIHKPTPPDRPVSPPYTAVKREETKTPPPLNGSKPALPQAAIQSSISNLRSASPPIAAIVSRVGDSKTDLSASRPILNSSPNVPPLLQFMVEAVPESAPIGMSAGVLRAPVVGSQKRLLFSGGRVASKNSSQTAPGLLPVTVQDAPFNMSVPNISAYPLRREGVPDSDNFFDSRQSLSNTVNRVAQQLLSPTRENDEKPGLRGIANRRAGTSSVLPSVLFQPH